MFLYFAFGKRQQPNIIRDLLFISDRKIHTNKNASKQKLWVLVFFFFFNNSLFLFSFYCLFLKDGIILYITNWQNEQLIIDKWSNFENLKLNIHIPSEYKNKFINYHFHKFPVFDTQRRQSSVQIEKVIRKYDDKEQTKSVNNDRMSCSVPPNHVYKFENKKCVLN